MKTIGFVDYFIDEWHANNYPGWIDEISHKMGEDFAVKYAWAEEYKISDDTRNTDEWCREFGIERCDTIAELCEKSDYIMILSPSNPEKHLLYADEVLKYGKNTYIDKTFAPNLETAQKVFELGNTYKTKFFSTSALRYADELEGKTDVKSVMTLGGGSNFEEYIIHQIEMTVKLMGCGVKRVRVELSGDRYNCELAYDDGKSATIVYSPHLSFNAYTSDMNGNASYFPIKSDFFKNLMEDILRFFASGALTFEAAQTLEIIKIRDGLICGKTRLGEWITL